MDDIILGTHDDAGNKQKTDTMQRQPKKHVRISVLKKQKASDVGFDYRRDYLDEYILI